MFLLFKTVGFCCFLQTQLTEARESLRPARPVRKTQQPTPSPTPSKGGGSLIPLAYYEDYFAGNGGGGGGGVTCTTYSMSQYGQDYETPGITSEIDMWALHALQWKAYVHASTTGGTWDESNPTISLNELETQAYPLSEPVCSVPVTFLNNAEAATSGLYQDVEGDPIDPNGIWLCRDQFPTNGYIGALIAAMNMYYFETPTYTDIHDNNNDFINFFGLKAVIEQVTLCAEGDQPAHEVCGWGEDWTESYENIGDGFFGGGCANALGPTDIVLDSVTFSAFTTPSDGYFIPHFTVDGFTWAGIYGWYEYESLWNHLVFDPPIGTTEDEIDALVELANNTATNMLVAKKADTIKDDDVWIGKQAEANTLIATIKDDVWIG